MRPFIATHVVEPNSPGSGEVYGSPGSPTERPAPRTGLLPVALRSGSRNDVLATTMSEQVRAEAEAEFLQAMQLYQQSSGRLFPTWSEILELLKHLGYKQTEQG